MPEQHQEQANTAQVLISDGFAFILNLESLEPDRPIEIIPGFILARATSQQIDLIRPVVAQFSNVPNVPSWYERKLVTTEGHTTLESLNLEQFKYHVINFQGNNGPIYDLELVSYLAETELNVGVTFIRHQTSAGFGKIWAGSKLFMTLSALCPLTGGQDKSKTAMLSDILSIGKLYHEYVKYKNEVATNPRMDIGLASKLQYFDSLYSLDRNSNLRVLVLFSIIESTITHAPKASDPYDSITRQVKTKFNLLNTRFERPLDYTHFFGSVSPDKIWSALYQYRSAIAHGSRPDFKSDLQVLKSQKNALLFLHITTQRLLRQAMKEPLLIKDLQSC